MTLVKLVQVLIWETHSSIQHKNDESHTQMDEIYRHHVINHKSRN